jgi:hypothetical protein
LSFLGSKPLLVLVNPFQCHLLDPSSSTLLSKSFIISAWFMDLLRDAIIAETSTEKVPVEEWAAAVDTNPISDIVEWLS